MKLVSITDLVSKFKITRYTVYQCVRSGILPVAKEINKKQMFEKNTAEEILKSVLSLKRKQFPLKMIAQLLSQSMQPPFES